MPRLFHPTQPRERFPLYWDHASCDFHLQREKECLILALCTELNDITSSGVKLFVQVCSRTNVRLRGRMIGVTDSLFIS